MAYNASTRSATPIILTILSTANPVASYAIILIYTWPIYSDPYKQALSNQKS